MMQGHPGWSMGGMWLWWIVAVIVLIFIVRGAWSGGVNRGPEPESPEDILKRRLANGEIDRDEYVRRLEDLRR